MLPFQLKKVIYGSIMSILIGFFNPQSKGDTVRMDNSSFSTNIHNNQIFLKHYSSFAQEGYDGGDSSTFPPMTYPQALRAWTTPYATNLSTDNRPTNSLTPFHIDLVAKDNLGGSVTTSNYLYFTITSPLDYGRKDYKVEIDIWGNGSSNSPYFSKTYGLQDLVSNKSSKTDTWGLTNLADNTKYGRVIMTPLTNIYSSGYSVNIENGDNFGLNPTNFTSVPAGGSVTSSASNVYYTNYPGSRTKINGLKEK